MASQIYSRYIPPPKKTPASKSPAERPSLAAISPEPPIPTPSSTRRDASSTYARYVPPPKTKAERHPSSSIPAPDLSPSSKRSREEGGDEPASKRTKQDKPEKRSRKNRDASDEPMRKEAVSSARNDDHASFAEIQEIQGPKSLQSLEANGQDEGQEGTGTHKQKKPELGSRILDTASAKSMDPGDSVDRLDERKSKKKKRHNEESAAEDEPVRNGEGKDDGSRHKRLMEKRLKSLKKAEKLVQKAATESHKEGIEPQLDEAHTEVHDLVPLPQPDPVPEPPTLSTASSLPHWLASPIRVPPNATASFLDFGIEADVAKILQKRGFNEAFAVQAAVLPLLLPGKLQQPGDILVSAPTGSGKTLAYVLPMVEDISRSQITRLRGLIIMPTRELVTQAKEICEICASAFPSGSHRRRVRIGTAVGNETLKAEQSMLMDQELVYDPAEYEKQQLRINGKWQNSNHENDDEIFFDEEAVSALPDHVFHPVLKIDILICTPGRLVEHVKSTPGFTVEDIKWLVVDEADKLLDQSFQQWLDVVMSGIVAKRSSARLRDPVRKIILSATMTRDTGLLNPLKLHRPRLVQIEGLSSMEDPNETQVSQAYVLPSLLLESGVKVEDENIKPLYLMELLRRENVLSPSTLDDSSSTSDSSEDEFSSDETSTHSVEDDSSETGSDRPRGVLIFTKSNESAVRLGRLVVLLSSSSSRQIGTLTSTTPRASRKLTLRSFLAGEISVLVASDLVSRGLDLPNLAHVINYDVPTSLTSYIHRIGRTARAGKRGCAWTLFTPTEGRWFWNEIGRADSVERGGGKVGRVNIKAEIFDDEQRSVYEEALLTLGEEARSARPRVM